MVARIVSLSLVFFLSACAGQPDPPDVAYRKLTMDAVRSHFGSIGMLISGRVKRDGDLQRHARALAALGESAGGVFPEGSTGGSTEAKPDIWQQPEKFQEALDKLRQSTAALAAAVPADDADALKAAFNDVRGACHDCHEQFRD